MHVGIATVTGSATLLSGMNRTLIYLLLCLVLSVAYVGIALVSRRTDWAFGREWLNPIMMWLVLTTPLCYAAFLRKPGERCCGLSKG